MKQQITEKQFSELSDKGGDNYVTWTKSKDYGENEVDLTGDMEIDLTKALFDELEDVWVPDLLSIGQMIEFLETEAKPNDITDYWDIVKSDGTWSVGWDADKKDDDLFINIEEKEYKAVELCDALWEAVKEVL